MTGLGETARTQFRESDRDAMIAAFDLWSFDDVKANADDVGNGSRCPRIATSRHDRRRRAGDAPSPDPGD
jgi:hypothetical protein